MEGPEDICELPREYLSSIEEDVNSLLKKREIHRISFRDKIKLKIVSYFLLLKQ